MYTTIKIDQQSIFMSGDGQLGEYTRLLCAIVTMMRKGHYLLMYDGTEAELKGRVRLEVQHRERVLRHLERQLAEIARRMNKKMHRRYVHWSNSMGRYFDDGE